MTCGRLGPTRSPGQNRTGTESPWGSEFWLPIGRVDRLLKGLNNEVSLPGELTASPGQGGESKCKQKKSSKARYSRKIGSVARCCAPLQNYRNSPILTASAEARKIDRGSRLVRELDVTAVFGLRRLGCGCGRRLGMGSCVSIRQTTTLVAPG